MPKISCWLLALMAIACSSPSGKQPGMDRETKLKFDQYMVNGKKVYDTYCANCHQREGEGLAQLYPPLAGSDYLLENIPRAACIIKNGQFKEIVVNGVTFNQMMPALSHLTNLEIAEVTTYISNSWGNEGGYQSVKAVDKWLVSCEEE